MSSFTTTVHVVRRDSPGVLLPPTKVQERHMVLEYGAHLESPLLIGTAYIHDWPKEGWESRWLDDCLRPRMTSRMDIRDVPVTQPTVPHIRP